MPYADPTQPQNAGIQPAPSTGQVQESYDGSPEGVLKCINDIRTKLDALEASVSQAGAGAEPVDTGAEPPMAPQTDEEVVAGIPPRPMSGMMGR